MPPKSSSKKTVILWLNCDRCEVAITSRDKESHEKVCPIGADNTCFGSSYIRDGILFTTNVQVKSIGEELNDIPVNLRNQLIFISEAAIRLCRFVVGEHVAIGSNESSEMAPVTRLVWPIPDKFLDTVFVTEEDFQTNWSPIRNQQIKIGKLPSDPIPVDLVTLRPATLLHTPDARTVEDLCKVLSNHLRHQVICKGHAIKLNFYNKTFEFTVTDVIFPKIYSATTTEAKLESEFDRLNLHEGTDKSDKIPASRRRHVEFFLITGSTKVRLASDDEGRTTVESNLNRGLTTIAIGGLDDVIARIREPMEIALRLRDVPAGFKIGRALLLFGHTGCGKTMLCEAIANELKRVEVIKINSSEIFSKYFGETERNLQKEFERAVDHYPSPSLIIIEDLNNICPKHDTNEIVKRVSAAFLGILDNLHSKLKFSRTFVLATCSNVDSLNAAVRRCGRFDIEVEVNVPDENGRYAILRTYLDKVEHSLADEDIRDLAKVTHAFVGADLANLISKSAVIAMNSKDSITKEHVNGALNYVKPSAMREVLIENPNVRWDDIGGQRDLKLKLRQAIEWPLLYPDKLKRLGIKPPRGILMFGPPGCSKTMIAKALATDSKVNFLSIKGPELFSMWVGESERAVREVFRKARQVAPAIIFFDEIDAIGSERSSDGGGGGGGSGSSVKERVLAQMLTELDGVDSLNNVTIVAATNRPDMIDKALMRPGRIDRIVYVGLPDNETRHEIFAIKLKSMPLADDVEIEMLVARTEGYSGAEIQAVCHEAALNALETNIEAKRVEWQNFVKALSIVQPRTDSKLLRLYEEYLKQS